LEFEAEDMADEWVLAAESGNMPMLEQLFQTGGLDNRNWKVQHAAVCAANAEKENAVIAFLEWGVQPSCQDKDSKRLLHACCRKGLDTAVAVLVEKRVDVNMLDWDKSNALGVALKLKQLGCIKELLKTGLELPPGHDTIPGLSAIVKEVQTERQTKQLRTLVDTEVDPTEIAKAEAQVWESMQTHLHLLKLDQDAKAAKVLVQLERKADEEQKLAAEAKNKEARMRDMLKDRKVEVAAQDTALSKVVKELTEVQDSLAVAQEEDAKVAAELSEKKKQLKEEKDMFDAIDKEQLAREKYAADVLQEVVLFEAQVEAARVRNEELGGELTDAKSELRSWLADKEAAAQLTAKAHALMQTG